MGGQVTDNSRGSSGIDSPQAAADELDSNRIGLFIGEGEDRLSLLAIDELDAKDFSIWEGGFDSDSDCRSLGRVLDLFCDLL